MFCFSLINYLGFFFLFQCCFPGVTVSYKYDASSKKGTVSIFGLEPGSTVCVQSEVKFADGDDWIPWDCEPKNDVHYIYENAKDAEIRSKICGRESDLCGEYFGTGKQIARKLFN